MPDSVTAISATSGSGAHRRPRPAPASAPAPAQGIAYAPHRKIHPKAIDGAYRRIKTKVGVVLTALFLVLPWLRWDRGGHAPDQAVLFDLANQRFYLFSIELWPQHVYFFVGAMILAAVALFAATAIAGRVWCGFTCPHTVWTDLFVWVERLTEGDRGDRIRLDGQPWTLRRTLTKTVKHGLWLLISLITGCVSIFYLTDAPTLVAEASRLEAPSLAVGSVLFMTACTYVMAGYMREQMCLYVCPWPRFQAAMVDERSLIVTYQDWRGEGRAPVDKGRAWSARRSVGQGDCIDCGRCVQVCPTGVDIRDGNQMGCISCGLCVDACNDVMTRIGRPGDLIRFDTLAAQGRKAAGEPAPRYRLIRPRIIVYALILITVTASMGFALALKSPAEISVLRDRAPLFVTLTDGRVQNAYTIKIANMTLDERRYHLSVTGPEGARLSVAGGSGETNGLDLSARANGVETYRVLVRVPAGALSHASSPLAFTLTSSTPTGGTAVVTRHETVFLAP